MFLCLKSMLICYYVFNLLCLKTKKKGAAAPHQMINKKLLLNN